MSEAASTSHPDRASPWPVAVAVSLPLAEAGIFFDVPSLAGVGTFVFGACVAFGLADAGYVRSPARALLGAALGALLLTGGLLVGDPHVPAALALRAWATGVAAVGLLVTAVAVWRGLPGALRNRVR